MTCCKSPPLQGQWYLSQPLYGCTNHRPGTYSRCMGFYWLGVCSPLPVLLPLGKRNPWWKPWSRNEGDGPDPGWAVPRGAVLPINQLHTSSQSSPLPSMRGVLPTTPFDRGRDSPRKVKRFVLVHTGGKQWHRDRKPKPGVWATETGLLVRRCPGNRTGGAKGLGSRQLEPAAGSPSTEPHRGRRAEAERQGRQRSRPPPLQTRPRPPLPLHSWGRGGPGGGGGVDVKQMAGQAGPRPGGGARSGEGSARLGIRARKPRAAPSQPLVCGDRQAPGRGLPAPCGSGLPDGTQPGALGPLSSLPPARRHLPTHPPPRLAPRHPHTPAPWPRVEMPLTSLWPLTGRPSPPTPAPTPSVLSSALFPRCKVFGRLLSGRACPLPVPRWLPQPAPRGVPRLRGPSEHSVSPPGSSISVGPQRTSLSFRILPLVHFERRLLSAHLHHHPLPLRAYL